MREKLTQISEQALLELKSIISNSDLEAVRVKYLGKKGELTSILRGMGALSPEERPLIGKIANEVREEIEKSIESISREIKEKEKANKLQKEVIDISMPGKKKYNR